MVKNKFVIFTYFLLIVSVGFNFFFLFKLREVNQFLVTRVSDGDTIVLNDNRVVRLANIDAPEYNTCGGQQSKDFLEKLVLGKKVKLNGLGYDEYNRTLGIVYLNNQSINHLLISSGWADYDSNFKEDRDLMSNAAIVAKQNQVGIYSLCRTQSPPSKKCTIKANNHRGQKIYFLPNCSNYQNTAVETDKGDQWFCNEKEAQSAGYKKSGDCR